MEPHKTVKAVVSQNKVDSWIFYFYIRVVSISIYVNCFIDCKFDELMSIEQEKESILKSIDSIIERALRDGKAHRIEIEIKHSKIKTLGMYDREKESNWVESDIQIR